MRAAKPQTRKPLRQRLDASIVRAQWLSAGLAIAALVLGLLWAMYIVRMFSRRLRSMLDLAQRMADGDYNTQIVDKEQDEVSELTAALNVMARTVGANISQLESRNQELDQFAYVVSHDLKAPLRGIESASRWIEEDMGKDAAAAAHPGVSGPDAPAGAPHGKAHHRHSGPGPHGPGGAGQ